MTASNLGPVKIRNVQLSPPSCLLGFYRFSKRRSSLKGSRFGNSTAQIKPIQRLRSNQFNGSDRVEFRFSPLLRDPSLRTSLNLKARFCANRSETMADEHKHEESLPSLDPAVEVVERESLMEKISEKIHHKGDSSDDESEKKPSSLKSKVYRLFGRERPVHKVLGGGKPADIFMWKNKKMSGGVLGGATVAWVLFELMEYHLLTLLSHVMIVTLAVLFLWSNATIFIHKSPPKIPEVHIPEEPLLQLVSGLRIEINRGFSSLREIASGRDLKKFLIAISGLWILSILGGCCSFLTLAYIALVLLFTVPLVYDKYEDKVDSYGEKAMAELKKQYAVLDSKVLSKIPRGPLKDKKKD